MFEIYRNVYDFGTNSEFFHEIVEEKTYVGIVDVRAVVVTAGLWGRGDHSLDGKVELRVIVTWTTIRGEKLK